MPPREGNFFSRMKYMSKKIPIFLIIIVVLGVIAYFIMFKPGEVPIVDINNFEECIVKGYPVLESYPRQCRTPDGETFTENIGNELEKQDLIWVSSPRPNTLVQTPLEIKGEARGYWFFEADFPVRLLDADGNELGTGIARTFSEWMTEDFVPFEAKLEFQAPTAKNGMLILEKDNPSGLPEYADELRIPITFQ